MSLTVHPLDPKQTTRAEALFKALRKVSEEHVDRWAVEDGCAPGTCLSDHMHLTMTVPGEVAAVEFHRVGLGNRGHFLEVMGKLWDHVVAQLPPAVPLQVVPKS